VNILAFVGVIVDPTTSGVNDSERAMTYFRDCDESEGDVDGE
jgi:phi LC3 family holin